MARAADVLKPKAVVIENVATVQWDATGVVERTVAALIAAGYKVAQRVVDLRLVGVPKTRKRPRRDRWPGDVVRPRINFGDDGD
jgi:DNA (cytosine-5)-methyltransferase 1